MRVGECNCGEVLAVEGVRTFLVKQLYHREQNKKMEKRTWRRVERRREEWGRRWSRGRMISGAVWILRYEEGAFKRERLG